MTIDPKTIPGAIVIAVAIAAVCLLAALGLVAGDAALVVICTLGGVGAHAAASSGSTAR